MYDDDHYYLGVVIAESLQARAHIVTLVTPANCVSAWTEHTLEQHKMQARIIKLGINIITSQAFSVVNHDHFILSCVYSGQIRTVATDALVMLSSRMPVDSVYSELLSVQASGSNTIKNVFRVGDCLVPSTVAAAVYSGHLTARELGTDDKQLMIKRELV